MNRLVVGVSGGIAAFKAAAAVSKLAQAGAEVTVVMTESAQQFVGSATFAALSGRPVATQLFDPRFPLGAHIELAEQADLLCIAPATANTLAKLACGTADDLLSTLYLCYRGPVWVAPAMNDRMWEHPATQRNVAQLTEDGVNLIEPATGWLSCRQEGTGRMAEAETIVSTLSQQLGLN